MLATDHLVPSQRAPKQRLACERCRAQKLKCIRRYENGFEPCLRCLQAQTECITGLRKLPGRPAGQSNHPVQRNPSQEGNSIRAKSFNSSEPLDSGFVSSSGSITAEDAFGIPFDFTLGDSGRDSAAMLLSSQSPMSENIQDLQDSLFKYPEQTTGSPLWPSSDNSSVVSPRQSFHLLDQSSDPGFQLSRLQQNLSGLLFLLRSVSWEIPIVMRLGSGRCSCHEQKGDPRREFNPLTSTFEVISEFENLLNMLNGAASQRELQVAPGFRQDMNVSYSLTAISCYLQLVYIYDCVFSYVLDQASSNPAVRDFILNSTPCVSLGGFEVPSSKNIFGRLFVQLMQLKIKPIESALGLPEYCRVSKEPDGDGGNPVGRAGLLGGRQGESLLQALKQSNSEETGCTNTTRAIEVLTDKMTRIELFE